MQLEYGIPTDKIGLELRFGIEKQFFKEEGIELSLRIVFGGPEIASLYDSGELKFGEIGSPPATTAIAKGARFKIVGGGIRRRALQYFVTKPSIKSWEELKGKSIGVLSKGSCSYWFGRLVLESNGIDPDQDVKIIGLGERYARVVDLMESNEIHGAIISEMNVSIGEYRQAIQIFKALTEPAYCPTMQWMVVVANLTFLERERALIAAVLRACKRSYHYVLENRNEFAAFGAEHLGIDAGTMIRAIEREQNDMHYDCEIDMAGLDLAIELQRKLGAFSAPLRADDITDVRHLKGV